VPRMLLCVLTLVGLAVPAAVEPVADFYSGNKQIRLIIGFGVGDAFDAYARVLARHLSRHIPGRPAIVVQNMPGVGSVKAATYVQTIAPKDGTAIGLINPVATVDALFDPQQLPVDASTFDWIGSMSSETMTCGFWTRTPVTVATLRSRQFIVGGTAATSGTMRANRVFASVLGLDFKIVPGYSQLNDLTIAAERGEIDGYCSMMVSTLKVTAWDRYQSGGLQIPFQAAAENDPDLPNVPNAFDLVSSEEDRQLLRLLVGPWRYGKPFFAPTGIPADRLAALRTAFMEMHKDPAFIEEANKIKLNVRPINGMQVREAVQQIHQTPKAVIERARPIMGFP
jgi:tripartite-type tricarboxylate transporter receptor subunit TctC